MQRRIGIYRFILKSFSLRFVHIGNRIVFIHKAIVYGYCHFVFISGVYRYLVVLLVAM